MTSIRRKRVNNMSNYVQVPTHISGHILDLVLKPVGVDLVNRVKVTPYNSSRANLPVCTSC